MRTARHATLSGIILLTFHFLFFSAAAQDETIVQASNIDTTDQVVGKLYNSGVEKLGRKEFDAAIRDFDQAIALKPDFQEAYYNRGMARYQLKNYEGAQSDLDRSISLKPTAEAYYFKGKSAGAAGNKDLSIEAYSGAITQNPDYT